MNGKTHSYVALATLVTISLTNFPTLDLGFMKVIPIIGIPLSIVGGLSADIDKQETTMGQRHPWISKLFRTHRGITHSTLVCAGLFGLLTLFQGDIFVLNVIASALFGYVIGYWTHVFIDVFNGAGIPHMFPLVWKRMYMMRVVTGTFEETIYLMTYFALCVLHVLCIYAGWVV